MIKITILGANSFLAKNLYMYFLKENIQIKIFLYDIQDNYFMETKASYNKIDFNDSSSLGKINFDVDYIYYFIGKTGTLNGFKEFNSFIELNEKILLKILDLYVKNNSKSTIIYPSTRLVYKSSKFAVKENSKKELKSIYAITKYAAEKYIQLYHECFNVSYVIFRLCTPWGSLLEENGNYGTFKTFINQAKQNKMITLYGDGNTLKTYTYITDVCNAFFSPVQNRDIINDIFNIGGHVYSLKDIANYIASIYDAKICFEKWPRLVKKIDGGNTILDSSKLDLYKSISYIKLEDLYE